MPHQRITAYARFCISRHVKLALKLLAFFSIDRQLDPPHNKPMENDELLRAAIENVAARAEKLNLQIEALSSEWHTVVGDSRKRRSTRQYRSHVSARIVEYRAARGAYYRGIVHGAGWSQAPAFARYCVRGWYASRCLMLAATLRDWRLVEIVDVLSHEATLRELIAVHT